MFIQLMFAFILTLAAPGHVLAQDASTMSKGSAQTLFSHGNAQLLSAWRAKANATSQLDEKTYEKIRLETSAASSELNLVRAGGGSSNGGGGGLLYHSQGQTLVTTNDYWESQTYGRLEPVLDGESALQYLRRVLDKKIKPLDSYFFSHIEETIGKVIFAHWNAKSKLPLLSDLGNLSPAPDQNYTPVQIAIRYSLSRTGFQPEIFIDYDPLLLSKLDTQNQAMLILHEAIYVLGTELKQKDSAKVRALVNRLLSIKEPPHAWYLGLDLFSDAFRTTEFQREIRALGFADFVHLYEKELDQRSTYDLSAKRKMTYAAFTEKIRGRSGGIRSMTEEETFFYFWYFEAGTKGFSKSKNEKTLEEFIQSAEPETTEIQRICEAALITSKGNGSLIISLVFKDSMASVLRYCQKRQ